MNCTIALLGLSQRLTKEWHYHRNAWSAALYSATTLIHFRNVYVRTF